MFDADLENLVIALAALVLPLVIAYLLTVWTGRPSRRPKTPGNKQVPNSRPVQE